MGVNTGFGKLASVKIAPQDTATLQRNLILSHCCGVGEEMEPATVRLVMTLKLLSLARGASGVRWEILELIENCLARGVTPIIPSQGSVGASGDLAPLAHMTAVLIGEGEATYQGERLSGADALARAGLVSGHTRPQGRPWPHQWHASLHRLRPRRSVRRPAHGGNQPCHGLSFHRPPSWAPPHLCCPRSTP